MGAQSARLSRANRSFTKSLRGVEARFPAERITRRLRRAEIGSISELVQAIEKSRSPNATFYVWLLGHVGGTRAETDLLRILRSGRRSLWAQTAQALATVGRQRSARALTQIALEDQQAARREGASYALGSVDVGRHGIEVARALTRVLSSDPEPRVRAQAAESIASALPERGRLRREAVGVLIEHLNDPSADVRFWCAYALGDLRSKEAVPSLRRLAHDEAVVPGWWSVGIEARDALRVIAGGNWPERSPQAG